MKQWKKEWLRIGGVCLLTIALAGNVLAAEERTKINQVSLRVQSSIQAGGDSSDVSVTTDANTYSVEDVSVVNDEGQWTSGDVPRIEVTLEAANDYYFDSMSKSKVKLSGDDATYVTSHREDNKSVLIVTVKLDALEGSLEIESVEWEGNDTPVARWETTDGAKSYQLRLYRGNTSIGSVVTTTNEYYDFTSSMNREGEYYFKVRAINSNSKRGDWYESDSLYIDEDTANAVKNGTYQTSTGNNNGLGAPGSAPVEGVWQRNNIGWQYRWPDGNYSRGGWVMIKNIWYCFDDNAYMRTGWIQASDGKWYYCDPREGSGQGAMMTNTITPDGYWVDANGVWIP